MKYFCKSYWKIYKNSESGFRKVMKKFRNVNNKQVLEKFCIYKYFYKKLEDNFLEILRKLLTHFEIIFSQRLLKIFSEISGKLRLFLMDFGEVIESLWINSKKMLYTLWGNRTNDDEIFWNLGKIPKKFWRTEKFSINIGQILKKCKCKKNLGNI